MAEYGRAPVAELSHRTRRRGGAGSRGFGDGATARGIKRSQSNKNPRNGSGSGRWATVLATASQVNGGGHGGNSYGRTGSSNRLVTEEVAEVIAVLKPHWPPFCYLASRRLLSRERPMLL